MTTSNKSPFQKRLHELHIRAELTRLELTDVCRLAKQLLDDVDDHQSKRRHSNGPAASDNAATTSDVPK